MLLLSCSFSNQESAEEETRSNKELNTLLAICDSPKRTMPEWSEERKKEMFDIGHRSGAYSFLIVFSRNHRPVQLAPRLGLSVARGFFSPLNCWGLVLLARFLQVQPRDVAAAQPFELGLAAEDGLENGGHEVATRRPV
jgi:hypothetical protein